MLAEQRRKDKLLEEQVERHESDRAELSRQLDDANLEVERLGSESDQVHHCAVCHIFSSNAAQNIDLLSPTSGQHDPPAFAGRGQLAPAASATAGL